MLPSNPITAYPTVTTLTALSVATQERQRPRIAAAPDLVAMCGGDTEKADCIARMVAYSGWEFTLYLFGDPAVRTFLDFHPEIRDGEPLSEAADRELYAIIRRRYQSAPRDMLARVAAIQRQAEAAYGPWEDPRS